MPYHHGDLRNSLIEAGMSLLRGGGVAALTLRGAARAAGVSATATYRHFADKEALLAAIAAEGFSRFGAALAAADQAGEGVAALRAQGVAYVEFAVAEPALFRLMFGAAKPCGDDTLSEAARAAFGILASRVAALAGEADAETVTLAAWSIVHGLACLIVDGQITAADPAELAARIGERLRIGQLR
ncbi:WHG domain-containing protein [Acidiphilium iwatense]|uniref:WHG domain-containing protein n=2 Tax=Acidiphilium iwatense TaxID=768198 RepID=A0ABS9E086_9PROT|nr:TetR/AcrR family transcriptional regulator [Acidiphilium sp. AL]MCF3947440.1 WHG domain-containing protein [Acidiphilium iwatense]